LRNAVGLKAASRRGRQWRFVLTRRCDRRFKGSRTRRLWTLCHQARDGRGRKQKKEKHTMTYPYNQSATGTIDTPEGDSAAFLDALLIDDEFDDDLDRQIFAIRETLADFRNL
jgi:hypothetical protein